MRKPSISYGYWILATCFVCLCVFSGVGMYAFGIFFKPVMNEFGWSRGAVSFAFTMLYLVQGLFQPVAGRFTDRYGPRKVIISGALIAGLGFALLCFTNSLWHYYLYYGIVGIGLAALGLVPMSSLISSWFTQRTGTALGIATTGIGVGGVILSPVIGTYLIPNFGWRPSFFILAILIWLVTVPVALFVIRDRPPISATPQTDPLPETAELSPSDSVQWTLKMALKTSTFWLVVAGFLLSNFAWIGISSIRLITSPTSVSAPP